MTNKNRGEVAIKLGGKQYIMRPTFHALCSIEAEINKSIIDVLLQFATSKPKLSELESIIYNGIMAYGDYEIKKDDLGQMIFETGIVNVMSVVLRFLEMSLGMVD